MTDWELNALAHRLLEKWRPRFGLQDWNINIRMARDHDLGADAIGDCDIKSLKKCALIRVIHPSDYPPIPHLPQDIESTVVHELVHIVLEPVNRLGNLPNASHEEEQVVEDLTRAYLRTERAERG